MTTEIVSLFGSDDENDADAEGYVGRKGMSGKWRDNIKLTMEEGEKSSQW